MHRVLRRWTERLRPVLQSDSAFLEAAYREILGRTPDQDGFNHYRHLLRTGLGRTAVLLELMRSDEFRETLQKPSPPPLASLRAHRPERYGSAIDRMSGQPVSVFQAQEPADFDWLEAAILEQRYYELPGVWNLGVDVDKQVMAEIIASFAPARALELGCAAGAVLECLEARGVAAEGVEISSMALSQASAGVRDRIHRGDLLQIGLPHSYDIVFGLDVFEHLNPNRLQAYLERLARLIEPAGYLFCNIPAFGDDAIFGTVFPLYLESWEADSQAGRTFGLLHVDDLGYPIHGHLTWAHTRWWVSQFEAQGFRREPAIERALHGKYDRYMETRSPARKAFYVFSNVSGQGSSVTSPRQASVIDRIRLPSGVLGRSPF